MNQWKGIHKIGYKEALGRFKYDMEVYLLYDDGIIASAESIEDIQKHHEKGGDFGFEMEEFIGDSLEESKMKLYVYYNFTDEVYYLMLVEDDRPVYATTATKNNLGVKIDAFIEEFSSDDQEVEVFD